MLETIEDGYGNEWFLCGKPFCGLNVVCPGKVQCLCDDDPGYGYDLDESLEGDGDASVS